MNTDIFLSYASEDTSKAMELARVLRADGWSVWSEQEISTGQDSEVETDMTPPKAGAVVVLWSAFSVSSSRVKDQSREAKESNKLIPVLLDDARIPLSYRSLSTIDLRQWPDKESMPEMSLLKSAVSSLLSKNASNQKPKKPAATDDMTLSVRVANWAKNGGVNENRNDTDAVAQDSSLALERGITDILLDILNTSPDNIESKIDAYIMQLSDALRASIVICTKVNFSRMSVSGIRSIGDSKVTAAQEKTVLAYVNQYCSRSGEHKLHLEQGKWPEGKMLCLPLSQHAKGREYAWFIAQTMTGAWTQTTQERLLKLATGLQAAVNRAS